MKFQFNKTYFILFVILFITEVLIAAFLKTGFIRHTFGDYLCVILLYCFVKSFIKIKAFKVALWVLIIAYIVEFLQLTDFLKYLNLQNNKIVSIILGSTFHLSDLVAYTLGTITILIVENSLSYKN